MMWSPLGVGSWRPSKGSMLSWCLALVMCTRQWQCAPVYYVSHGEIPTDSFMCAPVRCKWFVPLGWWAAGVSVARFGRVVDPTAAVKASHVGVHKHCPLQCSCPLFMQVEFGVARCVVDPTAARNGRHRPLRCAW